MCGRIKEMCGRNSAGLKCLATVIQENTETATMRKQLVFDFATRDVDD